MRLGKMLLAAAAGVVGLFAVWQFFVSPWLEYNNKIAGLKEDLESKQDELLAIQKARPQLERWRHLSLATDPHVARREYDRYLVDLLRAHKIQINELRASQIQEAKNGQAAKKAVYTPLTFTVRAHATPANLAQMLQQFQHTPVAHKIKSLTVEPTDARSAKSSSDLLSVTMTVEALLIEGSEKVRVDRADLESRWLQLDAISGMRRGLVGLSLLSAVVGAREKANHELFPLATPTRDYASISRKNIFAGLQPPPVLSKSVPSETERTEDIDLKRFVYLTEITRSESRNEAFLNNRATKQQLRLRVSAGFNLFRIRDEVGESDLVKGKVVRIDPRDVYFVCEGLVYGIHIGQSLSDAMRRPLYSSEQKDLGLKIAE